MSFLIEHSKSDYTNFKSYCETYSLPSITDERSEQIIREIHKEIYKMYYLHSCIENENDFLKETVSDLLSVMFMARQGLTKGAMVILRSSIENFMRYLVETYLEDKSIIYHTVVLPLFENTKGFFYQHNIIINNVNGLYSNYSYLCQFSHSALTQYQSQFMTLSEIQNLNINDLRNIKSQVSNTVCYFLAILTYCFYIQENKNSSNISNFKRREFLQLIPDEVIELLPTPL